MLINKIHTAHTNYLFHKIPELSQVNKINFINKQKTALVTSNPALTPFLKGPLAENSIINHFLKLTWNSTDASVGRGMGGRMGLFKTGVSLIPLIFGFNI